jgi:hypothetical protein
MILGKWLGIGKSSDDAVTPATLPLDQRLSLLASSEDAVKVEVAQIKRLIDIIVMKSSPD